MPDMLILGRGGSINRERVVLIAPMSSAPIQKLLRDTDPSRVINMTYGYPRRSVVVFDNSMIAITSRTVEELTKAIHMRKELEDDSAPWW